VGKKSGRGTKWGGGRNIIYGGIHSAPDYIRRYGGTGERGDVRVVKLREEEKKQWDAKKLAEFYDKERRELKEISEILIGTLSCGVPVFIAIELLCLSIIDPGRMKEAIYSNEKRQILYNSKYLWWNREESEERNKRIAIENPYEYLYYKNNLYLRSVSIVTTKAYGLYFNYNIPEPIHPLCWDWILKMNCWDEQHEQQSPPKHNSKRPEPNILVWKCNEQYEQLSVPVCNDKVKRCEPKILVWNKVEDKPTPK